MWKVRSKEFLSKEKGGQNDWMVGVGNNMKTESSRSPYGWDS